MSKLESTIIYFTVATILLTAGCAGNQKSITYSSNGIQNTFAEGKGAIPHDFPLPIYPKASTTGSVSADNDSEHSKFLLLASPDSVEKIKAFYLIDLKDDGWSVDSSQSSSALVNLSAHKGDLESNVMLSRQGGKTTISLSVNKVNIGIQATESPKQYEPNKETPATD